MLIFVFSALIVLCDQFFKRWIVMTHHVGEETILIPGVLSLFRLHNPGVAFGFLSGQPWWLLAGIQLLAAIILIMIILRYTEGFWGSLGLAAVLGGTIGNLIDRIFTFNAEFPHHVVDMFRFLFIDFAVFNIADVFITLGFLTFLVHFIVLTFKNDNKALADGGDFDDYDEYDDDDLGNDRHDELEKDTTSIAGATLNSNPMFDSAAAAVAEPIAAAPEMPVSARKVVVHAHTSPAAKPKPLPDEIPAANMPAGNLTQAVDPMSLFGSGLQPDAPLIKDPPPANTGALPILDLLAAQSTETPAVEIAPLLDHVYGGQYIAKATQPRAEELQPETISQTFDDFPPTPVLTPIEIPPATEDTESLLAALSSLESELFGEGSSDDYDIDKILGEYGFESDSIDSKDE